MAGTAFLALTQHVRKYLFVGAEGVKANATFSYGNMFPGVLVGTVAINFVITFLVIFLTLLICAIPIVLC